MKLRTCIVTSQYPSQVGGVGHSAFRVANLNRRYDYTVLLAGGFFSPEDREPQVLALRQYGLQDRSTYSSRFVSLFYAEIGQKRMIGARTITLIGDGFV